jgi:broad specificity phosphatase PhoE
MKLSARFLLLSVLLSQMAAAQQATRTVFLVRHAEATSSAPDAALTPAGEKRAECLATMLKDSGINQIFVTDMARTQQTASPLAKALHITPTIVPAKDPNGMIRDVLFNAGGTTLVVGHSDTLGFILARMRAGTVSPIQPNEFDRLYITTLVEGNATQAVLLRYCGSAPAAGGTAPHPAASPATKKATPTTKKK